MKEEARKLWKTPQGASLLRAMLSGKKPDEISPEERETLDKLKEIDPPKSKKVNEDLLPLK